MAKYLCCESPLESIVGSQGPANWYATALKVTSSNPVRGITELLFRWCTLADEYNDKVKKLKSRSGWYRGWEGVEGVGIGRSPDLSFLLSLLLLLLTSYPSLWLAPEHGTQFNWDYSAPEGSLLTPTPSPACGSSWRPKILHMHADNGGYAKRWPLGPTAS